MKPIDTDPVDYTALIQKLGGIDEVSKDLGMPEVNRRTVYYWLRRNSVPGKYAPALIALAIARKVIKSIDEAPRVSPFADPAA
jgi:hypothetical protein